jgi:hypothetical protein
MTSFCNGMRIARAAAAVAAAFICFELAANASPPPVEKTAQQQALSVCQVISREARRRALPESFFARLIWKESAFNPRAVSPKGARGIAQFMPETAKARGLADPFQPIDALTASAHLLSELNETLGNLGLAAAAYNAGERRVRTWLDGQGGLPAETLDYVFSITGRPASDWARVDARYPIPQVGAEENFTSGCVKLASRGAEAVPAAPSKEGAWKPWGVQVAGSHSESVALATFRRLTERHADVLAGFDPLILHKRNPGMGRKRMVNVRLGADSRAEANRLCEKLLAKGCACVVLRN